MTPRGGLEQEVLSSCFDLLDGFIHQAGQNTGQLGIAGRLAGGLEILAHLADDVAITGFLEIRHDNSLRIGLSLRACLAELLGGPKAEELVAAGRRLLPQLTSPEPRARNLIIPL